MLKFRGLGRPTVMIEFLAELSHLPLMTVLC